jgi:hypothetical protein
MSDSHSQQQADQMREAVRANEKKVERITQLIEEENDPKTRGLLITLQCIAEEVLSSRIDILAADAKINGQNIILGSNTRMIDKAVTLCQVGAYLLGVMQLGVIGVGGYIFTNTEQLKRDVAIIYVKQASLDADIARLGQYVTIKNERK